MDNVPDFYQQLSAMGIGGILAAFCIWLLNKTWKDHTDTIKGFHEIERGRVEMLVTCMNENSKQTAVNTSVLTALHRRLDKDAIEREITNGGH